MKKLFSFIMLGAMALVGATTFNSCSSEEAAPVNPTFDGESVKTNFTISVGDVKSGTRMTADAVQAGNTFKGMTDIYLFPAKSAISATTAFSQGYINLPAFDVFDPASGTAGELATAQAKRYKDVSFAIGVNHFLFYAATATANKDNGELKPSYLVMAEAAGPAFTPAWAVTSDITTASTPDDIKFDLVPYQKDKTIDDVKTAGTTTAAIVNSVYKRMRELAGTATTASKDAVAARLNGMCDKMKNLNASSEAQAFAGSALSVQELIEDIYNSFYVADATTTLTGDDLTDYNTYYNPIITLITGTFTVTDNTATTGNYDLAWTTTNNFPKTELGLPDGGVALKYTATAEASTDYTNDAFLPFEYVQPSVDGMAVADVAKYTHPARLYYTINTTSMVKNSEYLFTADVAGKTWTQIQGAYTNGAVTTTTQSVIMKDQVQYAVGRLDVQAQVKTGVTILDSGSGVDGAADKDPQPVAVPSAGYKLTGVLIGGQKQVDWQFKPVSTATEMTIYDGNMTSTTAAKSGTFSDINHTLALETAETAAVNIALEFENTGNDFYGVDHKLIPAGSKFYLVAKLTPAAAISGNITGNPEGLTQVFKQDYTTIAKLTIGENSLKNAYNIIPDLRSPKLEFGLSVNLEWKAGITFEQEF